MAKRIGNQNPTQAAILPYRKSLYKEAIEIYARTGRTAQKWQQNLLKAIMAERRGLWTHTKFGYSLPRRNGKNEIAAMRELWGLQKGEQILHTAHRTTTSHSAWERLLKLLDKSGIEYSSIRAIGRERVEVESGGRVEFRTRSSKGGLGEGFDLLVIDEAQEYTSDQESALKYVVTDSKNPQTLFCGTPPTPLSSGTVFTAIRKSALSGDAQNTGWAEWSIEHEENPHNKDLWYLTNPSLGTIFTERSVADEIGDDAIDFNIQRLGLWIRYNQKSAISKKEWDALKLNSLPGLDGPLFVGVKYGHDGMNAAMSVAVKTNDEKILVEAIDCQSVRNGNAWILNFLSKAGDVRKIAIDGASGQKILEADLRGIKIKAPLLPTVKEIIVANAEFEQAIYQKTLCHMGQPSLAAVVSNCEKRNIGTAGGFGYRSQLEDYDIALMDSVILAHWLCYEAKPPQIQQIRY